MCIHFLSLLVHLPSLPESVTHMNLFTAYPHCTTYSQCTKTTCICHRSSAELQEQPRRKVKIQITFDGNHYLCFRVYWPLHVNSWNELNVKRRQCAASNFGYSDTEYSPEVESCANSQPSNEIVTQFPMSIYGSAPDIGGEHAGQIITGCADS